MHSTLKEMLLTIKTGLTRPKLDCLHHQETSVSTLKQRCARNRNISVKLSTRAFYGFNFVNWLPLKQRMIQCQNFRKSEKEILSLKVFSLVPNSEIMQKNEE